MIKTILTAVSTSLILFSTVQKGNDTPVSNNAVNRLILTDTAQLHEVGTRLICDSVVNGIAFYSFDVLSYHITTPGNDSFEIHVNNIGAKSISAKSSFGAAIVDNLINEYD